MKKTRFSEDGMDAPPAHVERIWGIRPLFEELAVQTVIGLDIAKRVFQLHTADLTTGEVRRVKLLRSELA